MAYRSGAGGSALSNFVPAIWSQELLRNLFKAHVFGDASVVNKDYEGEISSYGDTVKIHNIGAITIRDYIMQPGTAGLGNLTGPDVLSQGENILQITEAKYFNFQVDDIDKAQQTPKIMSGAMQQAAYNLSDVSDLFLSTLLASGVAAGNYVGLGSANGLYGAPATGATVAPVSAGAGDGTSLAAALGAYEALVQAGVFLDNANVPSEGRFAVVPPWFYAMLLKDQRFITQYASGTTEGLRQGVVGMANGLTIMKSNNVFQVASGATYNGTAATNAYSVVTVGHPFAATFAEQIGSVEAYRPQLSFSDAVKGLHLYGGKVVRPSGLVALAVHA